MLSLIFLLSAFFSYAQAGVFTTFPVASTSIAGGTTFNITWQSDVIQTLPLATSFGPSTIGLYTGSSQVQFSVVAFGTIQNLVNTTYMSVTIPANAGPNSGAYFIRFESLTSTLAAPIQAFSARFTLTNMTGTFTSAEITENNSNSTLVPVTSTAAPTTSSTVASTSTTSSMITSSKIANITSSATSSATSTPKSSAQKLNVAAGGLLMAVLGLVGLAL